ncbi:hypothetical protein TRFO_22861 [Tritrichomonas foetus]|uniref:Right handed beta helix domain-containing protein n=1 Tax=Tritrichomonas foetus TaxID=1144522 RepID=A0A1J4KFI1_9EUKA|nr:hypothetical protein TRFO_22861 [Tritrichomonas foetus]|eukprot:OHT08532.1 hypothetical protein TRFO_22861 [Tritrichomonas foetus]
MMNKLSFLTWLAVVNTTISSRSLLKMSDTSMLLLPRSSFSSLNLDRLNFALTTKIVSYQTLLLTRCMTDKASDFTLDAHAPLIIKQAYKLSGKINALGRDVTVSESSFSLKDNNSFTVSNSKSANYFSSHFTSTSTKPLFQIVDSDQVKFVSCNFSKAASGGIKSFNSNLKVLHAYFQQCKADSGAAIFVSGSEFKAECIDVRNCEAIQKGGAIFISSPECAASILQGHFSENKAGKGNSIFSRGNTNIIGCMFTSDRNAEIEGEFLEFQNLFLQSKIPKAFSPTQTPLATRTPPPIIFPTPIEEQATWSDVDTFTVLIIVIIAIVCIVFVIGIGFFVYWRMKKQRNTIYASEKEAKDENEMGTVEIKSKYSLSSVYEGLNP